MKIKRIYHPYWKWEEVRYNMWGDVEDTKIALQKAVEFTGDYKLYGSFMHKVITEWTYSCENALTDININRKAWLGHAAVAYATKIPEDITRKAWGMLTDEQRILANKEAEREIKLWERAYVKNSPLYRDMGKQMLFKWDT